MGGVEVDTEGIRKEACLLGLVELDGCNGRGCTDGSSGILGGLLGGGEGGEEVGEDEVPGPHIHGFLLTPYCVGVGIEVSLLCDEVEGEGVELLQAHKGNVLDVVLCTGLEEEIVHLARTVDNASDLGGWVDGLWCIGDDTAEARCVRGVGEVGELGEGGLIAEEPLGSHDDERLSEITVDLAAEDVEVVGGGSAVDDTPVGVLHLFALALVLGRDLGGVRIGELEEALEAGRAVFGSCTIISVGEEEDQATLAHPLHLTTGNELIDDDLGSVGEVTKLGLPQDERVGILEGVAKLKTQHSEFGERGVGDGEHGLLGGDVAEGSVGAAILLVVQHGVAVGEGTTLDVLA